jgi:predicted dehydrogenase
MVYRAALIGCGKIGNEFDEHPRVDGIYSHAGAYVACEQTELIAVCDPDPEKLQRCADKWHVAATFRDANQMFAEARPQIVSICSPDSTHYELLHAALSASGVRAVLAEKPLALEIEQADEIIQEAARRQIPLAVNYSRRYSDSYLELRQLLHDGGIGKVQTVSGYYTKGIIHNGTHWIDLAQFLLGKIAGVRGFHSSDGLESDPTLSGAVEFANGVKGFVQGCAFDDEVSFFEMDIVGSRGRVKISDSGHRMSLCELADDPRYAGYKTFSRTRQIDGGLSYALLNAVNDLIRALATSSEPRCSGRDALSALRIACALRDSARSGNPIKVDQN